MRKQKTSTAETQTAGNLTLANLTDNKEAEVVDAAKPNDTTIRERKQSRYNVKNYSEQIVREDFR